MPFLKGRCRKKVLRAFVLLLLSELDWLEHAGTYCKCNTPLKNCLSLMPLNMFCAVCICSIFLVSPKTYRLFTLPRTAPLCSPLLLLDEEISQLGHLPSVSKSPLRSRLERVSTPQTLTFQKPNCSPSCPPRFLIACNQYPEELKGIKRKTCTKTSKLHDMKQLGIYNTWNNNFT